MIALLFPVTILSALVVHAALAAHGRQLSVATLRARWQTATPPGPAPAASGGSRWDAALEWAKRAVADWARFDDDGGLD